MAVASPELAEVYKDGVTSKEPQRRSLRWSPNMETYVVDTATLATVGGLFLSGMTGLFIELTSPRIIHSVMSPEHLPTLAVGIAAGAVIGGVVGLIWARSEIRRRSSIVRGLN